MEEEGKGIKSPGKGRNLIDRAEEEGRGKGGERITKQTEGGGERIG